MRFSAIKIDRRESRTHYTHCQLLKNLAFSGSAVRCRVAAVAEGNEVVFLVRSRVAAKLLVVDFKVSHRSAELTTPAVSP